VTKVDHLEGHHRCLLACGHRHTRRYSRSRSDGLLATVLTLVGLTLKTPFTKQHLIRRGNRTLPTGCTFGETPLCYWYDAVLARKDVCSQKDCCSGAHWLISPTQRQHAT
jgi:hypothetical protein